MDVEYTNTLHFVRVSFQTNLQPMGYQVIEEHFL